jgi:hypothetical protein
MAFSHACFISYRHRPGNREYLTTVEDLRTALQEQVGFLMNEQVYMDTDRLQGGNFFNRALAQAICESVCMVVFYIPPYFDPNSTYCAREFKAMEQLEARRLEALGLENSTNGLIIPIVLRGWEQFPAEIRAERQCYNFEPYYTQKKRINQHREGRLKVIQIARYINSLYLRLLQQAQQLNVEVLCADCGTFPLPQDADVLPWLLRLRGMPGAPTAAAAGALPRL